MIRSTKGKLVGWSILMSAVALMLLGRIIYISLDNHLTDNVDRLIMAECQEIVAQLQLSPDKAEMLLANEWREHEHTALGEYAIYLQLSDETGHPLRQTDNLRKLETAIPVNAAQRDAIHFRDFEIGAIPFRSVSYRVSSSETPYQFVSAAFPMANAKDYLAYTQRLFFILTPIFLIIFLLGILIISRNALDPITTIINTAQKMIESGNLSERIEHQDSQNEIGELISTLNLLFAKVASSFERIQHFSSDASHELRTPLTIIRGNIEVVLSRDRDAPTYKRTLDSILEEVEKISHIIDNLLLLARIDEDNSTRQNTILRLDTVVREITESLAEFAARHQVSIDFGAMEAVEVLGNPQELRHAVKNIIENAIRYNRREGRVTVDLHDSDQGISLQVHDTGIGISPHDQAHIFERFYRADKARSREVGGSGLGLSIVQRIIERHDGQIYFQSTPNEGSTFRIVLPKIEFGSEYAPA